MKVLSNVIVALIGVGLLVGLFSVHPFVGLVGVLAGGFVARQVWRFLGRGLVVADPSRKGGHL